MISKLRSVMLYSTAALLISTRLTDAAETLSVQETLGAAFLKAGRPGVLRLANPDAKDQLYELLGSPEIQQFHPNIIAMIGYIGQDKDAKNFGDCIKGMKGELTREDAACLRAMLDALATMSKAGSKEATASLSQMASRPYWKDVQFIWPGLGDQLSTQDEVTLWAILAYGYSGQADWKEKATSYLQEIKDFKNVDRLNWRADPIRIQNAIADRNRNESAEVPPTMRPYLTSLFNGDMKNPGPAPSPSQETPPPSKPQDAPSRNSPVWAPAVAESEVERTQLLLNEAISAYKEITGAVSMGKLESVRGKLLDDGRILSEEKLRKVWPKLLNDLGREQKIIDAPEFAKAKTGRVHVSQERTVEFVVSESSQKIADVRASDITTVSFRMEGTATIGQRDEFSKIRGSATVDADGTLVAVMKKINGKWYWQPFGW